MSKKKTKKPFKKVLTKRILVGEYTLSCHGVELYLDPNMDGGEFRSCNKRGHCEISVGPYPDRWDRTVAVLLHEATEFVYTMLGIRFSPSPDYAWDNAAYMFVLNHEQFGEATARVGEFLSQAFGDLASAYTKYFRK